MAGMNKVMILGRLGKDPELRSFQNGGKVANLSLATSERWKDRDGSPQERTEWHRVAIFDEKVAEIAERYLSKGNEVLIEGQLETRKWTDKDGQEKYSTEIVVRPFRGRMTLVGGRQGGDAGEGGSAQGGAKGGGQGGGYQRGGGGDGPRGGGDLDDDIPFAPEWR